MLRLMGVLLACLAAQAADLGSMHWVDTRLHLPRGVSLVVHSRMRTRDDLGDFYQFRLGPQLTVPVVPRLSLLGAYNSLWQQLPQGRWLHGHRWFGGIGNPLYRSPRLLVDSRTIAERFTNTQFGDFSRVRERFQLKWIRKHASPWGLGEYYWIRLPVDGRVVNRSGYRFGGGIELTTCPSAVLRLGYEWRHGLNGPEHNIVTRIEFQIPVGGR